MNNELQTTAITIRGQVLKTEHATNSAAEEAARLLATMLNARGELECALSLGGTEIDHAYQVLGRTIGSMRCLAIMHKGLHDVATEVGMSSDYGTGGRTVPNEPGGHLRAVA